MKLHANLRDALSNLPSWAWIFVALCLFIPVLTLGGALSVGLGFGGAIGCATVAKDPAGARAIRVMKCAGITLGAWLGLILIALMRHS